MQNRFDTEGREAEQARGQAWCRRRATAMAEISECEARRAKAGAEAGDTEEVYRAVRSATLSAEEASRQRGMGGLAARAWAAVGEARRFIPGIKSIPV